MRVDNSIKNVKYNIIAQVLNLLVQFISRTIFIQILGKEYLGLNGLFSNILTILSLADMGIGTVLVYSMYKPLADKDETKIKQLMNMYKKIYNTIALIVFSAGICLTPFLKVFIKDAPDISNLHFIYILYLINTTVSYLCVYKISIINADQKNYIVSMRQQIFTIIANVFMIIILYLTKEFIFYLITQIIFSVITNIYLSHLATKMYPFIKDTNNYKLPENEKNQIKKDTFAMMLHKVGGVIVGGTDNLLMSIMIGLESVGIYSNYILLINAVKKFTSLYFTSITASIGNLNVESDNNSVYLVFKKIFYSNFIIYTFCSICLFCLLNPFIQIWLGSDFKFSLFIVSIIVLNFYIDGMRQTVLSFKDAMGLFTKDKLKPIIQSIANIILSIILTLKFGIVGIFLGTVLSTFIVCIFWEAYILFKYGLKHNVKEYLILYFKYFLIGIIILVITFFINSFYVENTIITLLIHFAISIFITSSLLILFTYRQEEFKYFMNLLKKKILRR